jgi:hypothetical protein
MAAALDRDDYETTARLELRALERMLAALCEFTEGLVRERRERREAPTRESDLQLAVFDERRSAAMIALNAAASEPTENRITRLERLVEALDCSRRYFGSRTAPAG